jgi:hypothetical protein
MKTLEPGPIRAMRDSFITGSLRDTADNDYIAARILHRNELLGQFLWASLQAVEKYLKAIILFHDGFTKNLRHDIGAALDQALAIERLGMRISDRTRHFVTYLNEQGQNRYFTYPRHTKGRELLELDHAVWQIRRYCRNFFFPHEHDLFLRHQEYDLQHTHDIGDKCLPLHRVDKRGLLEEALDTDKYPILRKALIYKNFYYGCRYRQSVAYRRTEHWTQPHNLIFPEILEWANDRILLGNEVVSEMERRLRTTIKPGR